VLHKNFLCIFFAVCAWIACIVAFGADLHQQKYQRNFGALGFENGFIKFYQSHYHLDLSYTAVGTPSRSVDQDYSSASNLNQCASGGQAVVALQAMNFIALTFLILLTTLRVFDRDAKVPILGESRQKYLRVEMYLAGISLFLQCLVVIIWGGSCYVQTLSLVWGASGTLVTGTQTPSGYVWLLICMFFSFLMVWAYHVIRQADLTKRPATSVAYPPHQDVGPTGSQASAAQSSRPKPPALPPRAPQPAV